jgi:hypothetical protein
MASFYSDNVGTVITANGMAIDLSDLTVSVRGFSGQTLDIKGTGKTRTKSTAVQATVRLQGEQVRAALHDYIRKLIPNVTILPPSAASLDPGTFVYAIEIPTPK